jgi:hypothetical protein
MKDPMKKAFDIVKGGDRFKTNPVAKRYKETLQKRADSRAAKGHVSQNTEDFWKGMRGAPTKGHSNPGLDSTPRNKDRKTNHVYAIRNSKNLLDKRAHLEEIGGEFHK